MSFGDLGTERLLPRRYAASCGFVVLYVLALGLALRFCARIYPGIYVQSSPFWNSILNGDLFGLGYLAAILAGLLHIGGLTAGLLAPSSSRLRAWLMRGAQVMIGACICLIAFGVFIGLALHRLPGMSESL